jgi:hypothetical protein
VSLNRYEFDVSASGMVKNNQRFAFEETLDLESVLGHDKETGALSQSCEA